MALAPPTPYYSNNAAATSPVATTKQEAPPHAPPTKVDTTGMTLWEKTKVWLMDYQQAGHIDPRTPEQLEREKWLFFTPGFGPRFNR